jgi:hypothetical protein
MSVQILTLTLDGITAEDYLTWVRDPEPPAFGRELRSVTARAEALGDTVEVELEWDGKPPTARAATAAAGLPLTPEVVAVRPSAPASLTRLTARRTRRHRQASPDTPRRRPHLATGSS